MRSRTCASASLSAFQAMISIGIRAMPFIISILFIIHLHLSFNPTTGPSCLLCYCYAQEYVVLNWGMTGLASTNYPTLLGTHFLKEMQRGESSLQVPKIPTELYTGSAAISGLEENIHAIFALLNYLDLIFKCMYSVWFVLNLFCPIWCVCVLSKAQSPSLFNMWFVKQK